MPAALAKRPTLYADQVPVIDACREAFNEGHTRVLLQAPTGFGKTVCFVYIAIAAAALGYKICIVVHRDELLQQVSECLTRYGQAHGFIAAGYPDEPWHPVQVCSVQTYAIRIRKGLVEPADLYIIDEAHHASASTYTEIWEFAPEAHILGVTATPKRTDGHGLDFYEVEREIHGVKETERKPLFTKLISGPSVRSLIDSGRLVEPWHYAPSEALDTSGLHHRYGEYVPGEALELVRKSKIHGDAIRSYKTLCPGVPAVAFCINREHCRIVAEEFNEAGIRAEVIDGTMSRARRRQLVRDFKSGVIKVLASANLITEGFDLPRIGCVILLRLSESLILYLQAVGRGLRADPGKTHCFILDHVRFIDKHGFGMVDAARAWTLEGTVTTEDEGVKQCLHCYKWSRSRVQVCEGCGKPFKTEGDGGSSKSKAVDYSANKAAEMKRYTSELERAREKKEAEEAQRQRKLEEKEAAKAKDPLQAFIALGKQRGLERPVVWAYQQLNMRELYKQGKMPKRKGKGRK